MELLCRWLMRPTCKYDYPGFKKREKKTLLSWHQCMLTGEAWEVRQFISLETAMDISEKGFMIPKTSSYSSFNSRQNWVVRRVSPGTITVTLFWTKYADPRQVQAIILELSNREGQTKLRIAISSVSCEEKRLLLRRFGRTARFWPPLVLRAQTP